MSLSTSLPQQSHPGALSLAKSSIRGRSPIRATMRWRTMSGFLLCVSIGLKTSCLTLLQILRGCPLVASRQISLFPRVQNPSPKKKPFPHLFFLIQTNAVVLYSNPQALITLNASCSCGYVAQRNKTQSSAAKVLTGSIHNSSIVIQG